MFSPHYVERKDGGFYSLYFHTGVYVSTKMYTVKKK